MPARSRRTNAQMMRDYRALELRRRNLTYRQIADQLGMGSVSRAYDAVQRALLDAVVESAEEVRKVELERLDELSRVAWRVLHARHVHIGRGGDLATDADGEPIIDDGPTLQAIDRLLKIGERRAKLMGLDAPTQVQVLTTDQLTQEIALLEQKLATNDSAGSVPA